jgi:hypothetical protein
VVGFVLELNGMLEVELEPALAVDEERVPAGPEIGGSWLSVLLLATLPTLSADARGCVELPGLGAGSPR